MIIKNLFKNILKIVSIITITLSISLVTLSVETMAIATGNNTYAKPITTVNFDLKGLGKAGNKVEVTFDSGEKFSSIVKTDGTYSINFDYPRVQGQLEIIQYVQSTTELFLTTLLDYDITKFKTDAQNDLIGPVLFSGTGTPGQKIDVEFPNGDIIPVTVGADGKYTVSPLYPSEEGVVTTSVGGVPTDAPYAGGITTFTASQITPPASSSSVSTVTPPAPTGTTPVTPTGTTTKAAAAPAKATVRSGGFLQIAGIIALFTVILAILLINKKFKR